MRELTRNISRQIGYNGAIPLDEETRKSLLLLSTQDEMQVLGFGFRFRVSGFGFGFRILGFGLRASGFGFRFRFWFLGFGFQVLYFGLRVSGFGFGFRVSGFGFRGLERHAGYEAPLRLRANSEPLRQSRPDFGLDLSHFQYEMPQAILSCSFDEETRKSPLLLSTEDEMQVLDFGVPFRNSLSSGFGFRFRFRDSGFGFSFRFRFSGFGIRIFVSGFGVRVRCRVSSPRVWVPGFGVRIFWEGCRL